MNAALETSRIWAHTHTARISTLLRYAHALRSSLTELTKWMLPIIDSLTVPMGAPAASSPNAASAFSSWVSTQVSTWGGLLRAHYSCADCLTHPLLRESSPARQRLTPRKAVSRETKPSSSTAPYAVRDRTDTTAIIRRHSPRGGAPRHTAYEPNCSRPEHRPCAACRSPSQVCWFL